LVPENELSKQIGIPLDDTTGGPIVDNNMETMVPGFFACGNAVQVHDLVDDVTASGWVAGRSASLYALNRLPAASRVSVLRGRNVRSVVPQRIRVDASEVTMYIRVKEILRDARIRVKICDQIVYEVKRRVVKPAVMEKIVIPPSIGFSSDVEVEVI